MQKTYLAAILAVLSGSLMAQTVVTVNGTKIDSSTVDAVVRNLQQQSNGQITDNPELRNEITRRLAVSTIIAQEAKKLKLDQSNAYKQATEQARAAAKKAGADKQPSFKQEWAMYETDLLNQAYFADVTQKNPVSETEVKQAYDRLTNHYKGTQEVQLGEIVTQNSNDAEKALGELKKKKSFQEVATKYSIDPQAKQTGGIVATYVPLKDLQQANPPMYQAIHNLRKGSHTEKPLQDNNGIYAIFYVNDKRNITIPPYDQIKARIGSDLQEARIAEAVDSLVQKANIQPAR
ncbi:peptidylprolyl isomerase [Neisseria wadsworthii]|uniref:peptidylprolyl isomerase n=1 Tax=Neisseria wadsworthii 9715 TaxID=1030841 RepID=G4CLQ1_9NEIS|nr:peptidyl-prolyl cis-trans isomerase [Neisseria wadsworthii]EGZ51362.1 peptidyl-prolyl cis-trans isomerase [Neisseria wadsworthii 9715]QMT36100.1 peptidyl-prolyl cis-trans isomerase [Neisseria wadsworthii]